MPTWAAAGDAASSGIKAVTAKGRCLAAKRRSGERAGAARAGTAADGLEQGRAGVNRAASAPLRNQCQRARVSPFAQQRDQSADVGGGIGTAVDDKPSRSRLGSRDP